MKLTYTLLLMAAPAIAQDMVDRAIANYNKVTANCASDSCKEDAKEAAAVILQRLAVVPAPKADLNEGRRTALRMMGNRQVGASPAAGGGTSITSLASVTDLLSAAMESGAFQRNTAGTVSTIRIIPVGLFQALTGDCPRTSPTQEFPKCILEDRSPWRGFSIMGSFDSARSDQAAPGNATAPAVFLRAQRGLASAGVRYDFFRPAKRDSKFRKDWVEGVAKLRESATAYAQAFAAGPLSVVAEGLKKGLPEKLDAELRSLPPQDRRAAAKRFFTRELGEARQAVPGEKYREFEAARQELVTAEVKLFKDTLDRRLFSLEYQHHRPKDEPVYGGVTFIFGRTAGEHKEEDETGQEQTVPNWELTANAGVNFFYDKTRVQKDRTIRDFQVSFQADRRLWNWKVLNQPTLTFAGYFQRLTDDAVISFNSDSIVPGTGIALPKPADVILKDTKGNVGIVQAKLTIPLKESGVSVPLAVTWSNRTELLRLPGNDVRGHFGLQFDMDKLLSGLKPKEK